MAKPKGLNVLSRLLAPTGGFNGLVACGTITNTSVKRGEVESPLRRQSTNKCLARELHPGGVSAVEENIYNQGLI